MKRAFRHNAALIVLTLLLPMSSLAGTVTSSVSYVSSDFLYIQAGRTSGVAVDDSVSVVRDGAEIAHLIILRVSETFSACSPSSGDIVIQVGDKVVVTTQDLELPEELGRTVQDEANAGSGSTRVIPKLDVTNGARLRGRVSFGYRFTDDLEPTGRDIREPWGYIRLTLIGVPSSSHKLLVRARLRRTERDGYSGNAAYQKWNNRVYQIALEFDDPENPFGYQAGRILSREVVGLGVMDGAMGRYRFGDNWNVGVFSGVVPDPITSEFSSEETQSGAFVAAQGALLDRDVDGTLAWIGRYRSGEINRESIYQQVHLLLGRGSGFYQSAELEMNRGWRRDVVGSSMTLSNLLMQLRLDPLPNLRMEIGYDSRRNVQDWRTRDLPDTLFDDALRQGFRGSLRMRLPWMIATAGGGIRTREGGGASARSLYAGASSRQLPGRLTVNITARRLYNEFTSATMLAAVLSRPFGRRIYLRIRTGASNYRMLIDDSQIDYGWIGGTVDIELGRGIYSTLDVEQTSGSQLSNRRIAVEMGYRFRTRFGGDK